MTVKTALSFDDDVYATARQCARDAGMSLSAWLGEAARAAARRQNAQRYGRWLAQQSDDERAESVELDTLTAGSRAATLSGTEW